MGRFFALVFAAIAAAAQVAGAQQGQNPKAALAPLAVLGDVPELRQRIIFNSLQSKLSEVYQLIPQELYEKAEEAAFQSLELAQCTEERCIRRIQEILQVERLAVLQIIRDGEIHQLTLTIVRTEDKIVRAGICRGCGTGELESRVAGLVSAAVAADLGGRPKRPVVSKPPVEAPKTGAVLVASEPTRAKIVLDGRALSQKTDTRLKNLAPGRHTLEVTKGNLAATRTFDLTAGQELRLNLQLKPKKAVLKVTSEPSNAETTIDLTMPSASARESLGFFLGTGLGYGNEALMGTSLLSGGTNLSAGYYLSRTLMIGVDYAFGDYSWEKGEGRYTYGFEGTYKKIGAFLRVFPATNSLFFLLGLYENTFSGSITSTDFIRRVVITDNDYTLKIRTFIFGIGNQWAWDSGFFLNTDWGWVAVPDSSASNENEAYDDLRSYLEGQVTTGALMLTLGWAF